MSIVDFAVNKKVLIYLLMIILLVGGYFGFQNLGRLEDPDFTILDVQIITPYPGATAAEVEKEVSDLIESVVQKLPQMDRVTSESVKGKSTITATFLPGYSSEEFRQFYDELRRKVNDVQPQLPPGAGPTWVNDDFKDVYGIFYAVTGEGFTERELLDYARDLQKDLVLVDGVAKVELWGMPQEVVHVEISRTRMSEMNLSPDLLASLFVDQNQVVDAGDVILGDERAVYEVTGTFDTVESIGEIRIPTRATASPGDAQVTLADIATIYRGYKEPPDAILRLNGRRGIGVAISAITTENVVEVGERIDALIYSLIEDTPIGIEIETIFNQPHLVKESVSGFIMSLVQSVSIVVGLLLIFMGVQSGIIIGFMLVLIIAGTLLIMNIFDITLQRISLGALIIAMGMLVDNSIVITEGILVRLQRGEKPADASKAVVKQTMWPLFAATIVAIFAFAAVGMSPDATGEYTKTLFYVIIISLGLSWFLAIAVNPLLCIQFLKPKPKKEKPGKKRSSQGNFYGRFLAGALRRKVFTTAAVVALLVLAVAGFGRLPAGFFPASAQPQFLIDYWLPEGTDISKTSGDIDAIEKYLLDEEAFPDITQVSTFIGASPPRFQLTFKPEKPNPRFGQFMIEVGDGKAIAALVPRIQENLDAGYPEALAQVYRFAMGPGGKGAIKVRFSGPDPDVLRKLSERAKQIFRDTGNAVAIRDDWGERAKAIRVQLNEREARRVGISRPQVNQALEQAFRGRTIGLYREEDKLIPIVSRPPLAGRLESTRTRDIVVWSPALGENIRLSQIVTGFEPGFQDTTIQRRNRKTTITAQCDPKTGTGLQTFQDMIPALNALEIPPGYTMEFGGEYEDSAKAQAGIRTTFPLAFLGMFFTIIVLWAKVKQPVIIFLSIPLSIIGIVLGLLLTGFPFSFMAIMGTLALFGMVIKNAIVMVDEIDLNWKGGGSRFDGIIDASSTRVRPVMMAALSTVLGMAPLVADVFFQGMAVVVMGGLTVASVITLIITPTLYALFFGVKSSEAEKYAPGAVAPAQKDASE